MSEYPKRQVRILTDANLVARAAAEEFVQRAIQAVRTNERCVVALAGGSTPKAMYQMLAKEPAFRDRIPWSRIHFFFGDERHVPPTHADSNFKMVKESLFDLLPSGLLPEINIHRMQTEKPCAYEVARQYKSEIEDYFGSSKLPIFDLVLLGMGPDGHTASLFPGTTALRDAKEWVTAVWVDKLSTYRVTLTEDLLCNAAHIVFTVTNADKAEAVKKVLEGEKEEDRYPSQRIFSKLGTTLWLLDADAAKWLR